MDTLRAVVLVTCVVSLLSGIMDAIKPNARFDRQMRFLLAGVYLLAVLTPLIKGAYEWDFDWEGETSVSDTLTEAAETQVTETASSTLSQSLTTYLETQGMADVSVQVEMHITEENSIEIERIIVSAADEETAAAAKEYIADYLGDTAEDRVEDVGS